MIIESIQLQNYRQYVDLSIKLSGSTDNKNFTVIQGANGCGKTNLLNAITWCLYGEEKHMDEKKKGLPLLSMATAQKMNPKDIAEVKAEIKMLDEDNKKIIFTRTLSYRKTDDEKIRSVPNSHSSSEDGSFFQMMREINKEMIFVETPKYVLNRMIPDNLEEYFFFDGERLNTYIKESKGKIRDEVFKISQMDLLETTLKHLKNKKGDFQKEASSLSSEAESIENELEIISTSIDDQNELLKRKKEQKEIAKNREQEYRDKLAKCDIKYISQRQKERDALLEDLKRIDTDLEEINGKKLDYLIKITPLIYLYEPIVQATNLISEREDAGDIPADYKRHFIEKLLENGKCICGNDISAENDFRQNVTMYLDQCDHISDISEELAKLIVNLKSSKTSADKFDNSEYNKTIKKLTAAKKEKGEAFNEISEEIATFKDFDEAVIWDKKLREYSKSKEDLLLEIGRIEKGIDDAEKRVKGLEKKLDDELSKEKKSDEIRKILLFCDTSLGEINKIKSEIMDEFRKELEQKTEEQFFELIWKKDNYKKVTISDDYELSVIHQSGLEAINSLSAGERQVLALSFMAALNNVSGFDVPIVIDTPLGRISKEPKLSIAENLPNYLSGKQAILLVTEEEYTSGVRDKLYDRVGKEYRIVFEDLKDGAYSRVIPYAE